jgi:hypothetical protein
MRTRYYRAGVHAALAKFSQFNLGMYPTPDQLSNRMPQTPDNGDGKMRGTNFSEPNTRSVSQAFNSLAVSKNVDYIDGVNSTPPGNMDGTP